jgi:uncharacterized protein
LKPTAKFTHRYAMKIFTRNRILSSLAIFGVVILGLLGYGYFIEPNQLVVTRETIAISNWNKAFDGMKVVMIGDVHGGSNNVTEEKLREVVRLANAEQPDMVVMLGDYVSQHWEPKPMRERSLKMPVATIADGLSGLSAKYGVFAVLGNHDSPHSQAVTAEFTRVGYRVLQNEVAVIEKDGARLRILGMIDHLSLRRGWKGTSEHARQQVEAAGTGDIMVLQHSPDIINVISGEFSISPDLRLMLAAHTHGGQISFPLVGPPFVPSGYGQKYARGYVRENGVDMFVTSGLGTSIMPFRFGVPPEIVVLTIRKDEE